MNDNDKRLEKILKTNTNTFLMIEKMAYAFSIIFFILTMIFDNNIDRNTIATLLIFILMTIINIIVFINDVYKDIKNKPD